MTKQSLETMGVPFSHSVHFSHKKLESQHTARIVDLESYWEPTAPRKYLAEWKSTDDKCWLSLSIISSNLYDVSYSSEYWELFEVPIIASVVCFPCLFVGCGAWHVWVPLSYWQCINGKGNHMSIQNVYVLLSILCVLCTTFSVLFVLLNFLHVEIWASLEGFWMHPRRQTWLVH